jgi:RNA polymerase sigma factor (sigma-70 family)
VPSGVPVTPEVDPSAVNLDEWFNTEVHPHDHQLKAYLRGSFPKMRDVDDVVQESYLRVWQTRIRQPIQSAKALLFTIARRLAIDWVRHDRVTAIDQVEDLETVAVYDNGNSAADAVHRADMIDLLVRAVDALPARCREVMILRKLKLLSPYETARRLGISEHTVYIQCMRGTNRVREYLAARGIKSVIGHEN